MTEARKQQTKIDKRSDSFGSPEPNPLFLEMNQIVTAAAAETTMVNIGGDDNGNGDVGRVKIVEYRPLMPFPC